MTSSGHLYFLLPAPLRIPFMIGRGMLTSRPRLSDLWSISLCKTRKESFTDLRHFARTRALSALEPTFAPALINLLAENLLLLPTGMGDSSVALSTSALIVKKP